MANILEMYYKSGYLSLFNGATVRVMNRSVVSQTSANVA